MTVATTYAIQICSLVARGDARAKLPYESDPPFCSLAQALNLSPALATGLILVSCCPGGQVRDASPLLKATQGRAGLPQQLAVASSGQAHISIRSVR